MATAIEVERQRVEHQRLRKQVLVDELTGLGNRRAYTAHLEELRRSALGAASGALAGEPGDPEVLVMMLDVDHFKAVNDEYGHDVGDEVLRRIGALLLAQVRSSDLAARLGGDEFVVILTQHDEGPGDSRAEAIVASVSEYAWDEVAPGLKVTVSLGLHHGPAGDLALLLGEADRQLYVAKRGGRGRVAGSRNELLQPGS
jgi:diguanylate cyclase (GGDEF)-like protein